MEQSLIVPETMEELARRFRPAPTIGTFGNIGKLAEIHDDIARGTTLSSDDIKWLWQIANQGVMEVQQLTTARNDLISDLVQTKMGPRMIDGSSGGTMLGRRP